MAGTDATHEMHPAGHQDPQDGHGVPMGHDAHAQEPLGPVDWAAWGFALMGAAAAAVIAVALYLSANPGA